MEITPRPVRSRMLRTESTAYEPEPSLVNARVLIQVPDLRADKPLEESVSLVSSIDFSKFWSPRNITIGAVAAVVLVGFFVIKSSSGPEAEVAKNDDTPAWEIVSESTVPAAKKVDTTSENIVLPVAEVPLPGSAPLPEFSRNMPAAPQEPAQSGPSMYGNPAAPNHPVQPVSGTWDQARLPAEPVPPSFPSSAPMPSFDQPFPTDNSVPFPSQGPSLQAPSNPTPAPINTGYPASSVQWPAEQNPASGFQAAAEPHQTPVHYPPVNNPYYHSQTEMPHAQAQPGYTDPRSQVIYPAHTNAQTHSAPQNYPTTAANPGTGAPVHQNYPPASGPTQFTHSQAPPAVGAQYPTAPTQPAQVPYPSTGTAPWDKPAANMAMQNGVLNSSPAPTGQQPATPGVAVPTGINPVYR